MLQPIYWVLWKGVYFEWGPEQERALQESRRPGKEPRPFWPPDPAGSVVLDVSVVGKCSSEFQIALQAPGILSRVTLL